MITVSELIRQLQEHEAKGFGDVRVAMVSAHDTLWELRATNVSQRLSPQQQAEDRWDRFGGMLDDNGYEDVDAMLILNFSDYD